MADEKVKKEGRVIVIDPNAENNGLIPNEDLFIYAKIYAQKRSRSILTIEENQFGELVGELETKKSESVNFLTSSEQNGDKFLTTNWSNMGGGNKESVDEAFGIESIKIDIKPSLVPQVEIDFKDARAAALFDALERQDATSKYDVFLRLPYPIFYLKVKGHYGKDVTIPLHLTKFDTSFEDTTGSFKINGKFIGMTHAFFADLQLGHIMGLLRTKKGKQYLANVYEDYGVAENKRLSLRDLNIKIGELQRRFENLKTKSINDFAFDELVSVREKVYNILNSVGLPCSKSNNKNNLRGNIIKNVTKPFGIRDIIFFDDTDKSRNTIKKINKLIDELNGINSIYSLHSVEYHEIKGVSVYDYLTNLDGTGTNVGGYELLSNSIKKESFEKTYGKTLERLGDNYLVTKNSFISFRYNISELLKEIDETIKTTQKEIQNEVNETFKNDNGLKFTTKDVLTIISANIEAFMLYIYETSVKAESTSGRNEQLGSIYSDIPPGDPIYPFPDIFKKVVEDKVDKYESVYLGEHISDSSKFPELDLVEDAMNGILNDKLEAKEREIIEGIISNTNKKSDPQPVSTREIKGVYNGVTNNTSPYDGFVEHMWDILVQRIFVAKEISNFEHFNTEGDAYNIIEKIKKSPKIVKLIKQKVKNDVIPDVIDSLIEKGRITTNGSDLTYSVSDLTILDDYNSYTMSVGTHAKSDIIKRKIINNKYDYYDNVKKEYKEELENKDTYIPFHKIKRPDVIGAITLDLNDLSKYSSSSDNVINAYNFINGYNGVVNPSNVFNKYKKTTLFELPKPYVLYLGAHLQTNNNQTLTTQYNNFFKDANAREELKNYFNIWAEDFDLKFKKRFLDNQNKFSIEKYKVFRDDSVYITVHDPTIFTSTGKKTNLTTTISYLNKEMSKFVNILRDDQNLSIEKTESENTANNNQGSSSDDDVMKLAIYNHFKNIYDKWLGGSDSGNTTRGRIYNIGCKKEKRLKDYFHVVDTMWRDIGDIAVFNVLEFSNLTKKRTSSMLNFINDIVRESGFTSLLLPFFPDMTFKGAKEMWKPHTQLTNESDDPVWLCVYGKDESNSLNLYGKDEKLNKKTQYVNDGYDFNDKSSLDIIGASSDDNNMLAFKVAFGQQNQSIFKGFNVSTTQFSETEESLRAMSQLFDRRSGNQRTYKGGDLFPVHRIRSYETTITSMGNFMISPLMYFNLENVPFFNGAHYITNVSHSITPNTMVTTFKGTRQRSYSAPVPKELTTYIKLDFSTYKSKISKNVVPEEAPIISYEDPKIITETPSTNSSTYSMYKLAEQYKNYDRGGTTIDMIIIHWGGGFNIFSDHKTLIGKGGGYHFIVDPNNKKTFSGSDLDRKVYHAGGGIAPDGKQNVNSRSIGVSIMFHPKMYGGANPRDYWLTGDGRESFETVKSLVKDLKDAYPSIKHVTGHYEVKPQTKYDVYGFPYDKLGVGGVSYWQPTGNHQNASKYVSKKSDIENLLKTKGWATFDSAMDFNSDTEDLNAD